jgi:hypothetical protein
MMKEVCFSYWQEQEIFLSYVVSSLALGLTQLHVQLMMLFSWGVKGLALEETYSAV